MKEFIKTVFATLVGLILFTVLGVSGLVAMLMFAGSSFEETANQLDDKTILTYDLSLSILDRPPSASPFSLDLESEPIIPLRTILQAIEAAAVDDNIVALYLNGEAGYVGAGYGTLSEIRQSLLAFKESGKPIIAYGIDWNERGYYLASLADTIVVNPVGSLAVDGLRSEVEFYGGALDKYGVGVQVIRVGQYKSAVEPYTETKLSEPNRQQLQALLGDLWQDWLKTVGNDRQIPPPQLARLSQTQGILTPTQAQSEGLVDAVQQWDQVQDTLRQLTETETETEEDVAPEVQPDVSPTQPPKESRLTPPTRQALAPQAQANPSPSSSEQPQDQSGDADPEEEDLDPLEAIPDISIQLYGEGVAQGLMEAGDTENQVAVVYAEGTIVSGEGDYGVISNQDYVPLLQELRWDPRVKAVVLRINSPGGSATASHLIQREVALLQQTKPVIVSMGNVTASGGYMMAASAEQIFAEPNTITGSIGVFGLLPNLQKIGNDHGVTWEAVTTGPYANLYTYSRPRTPAEMKLLQGFVDDIYQDFITLVAEGRGLSVAQVNQVAQGRVWSGQAAQGVKLVDTIGGLKDAIEAAVQAANLDPEDWYLQEYPYPSSLEQEILDRLLGETLAVNVIPPNPILGDVLEQVQEDWQTLVDFQDPRQLYMRLPYRITID